MCSHLLSASDSMGHGVAGCVAVPTLTSGRKGLLSEIRTSTEDGVDSSEGEGEEEGQGEGRGSVKGKSGRGRGSVKGRSGRGRGRGRC